jgi:hypothetical protein
MSPAGALVSVAAHGRELNQLSGSPAAAAGTSQKRARHATAEANKRTVERFTREFLPSGDKALGEQFISPDIVMHFAGTQQQGRDTYLGIVAANKVAFPHLVWTVNYWAFRPLQATAAPVTHSFVGMQQELNAGPGVSLSAKSIAARPQVAAAAYRRHEVSFLRVTLRVGWRRYFRKPSSHGPWRRHFDSCRRHGCHAVVPAW